MFGDAGIIGFRMFGFAEFDQYDDEEDSPAHKQDRHQQVDQENNVVDLSSVRRGDRRQTHYFFNPLSIHQEAAFDRLANRMKNQTKLAKTPSKTTISVTIASFKLIKSDALVTPPKHTLQAHAGEAKITNVRTNKDVMARVSIISEDSEIFSRT
jgi:3-deoxy-D-arabino-heptulosonate 7-phosphate (DAHP) synthase